MDFGIHGGAVANPPWILRDDCTSFLYLVEEWTVMEIEGQSKAILCESPFHHLASEYDGLFCIEFVKNFPATLIT